MLVEQQKTGKWLAEQIGKYNCTVSKWCSNSVQPDLKTLNDIAKGFAIYIYDYKFDDLSTIAYNSLLKNR